jgi:2-C-methyl-D-erythritol 4-phosphate cytidylyltransferase
MNDVEAAAIILAAGNSLRMGGLKKEYQEIKSNLTALGSAVSAFIKVPSVRIIVIAVPVNGEADARKALPPGYLSSENPKILFVNGGQSRRASVFNALSLLSVYNPRYVLIHDGARPWVSSFLVENIVKAVQKYSAVIPLLPITDTPKEVAVGKEDENIQVMYIKNHLKRANTGIAQTPQAFLFPEILHAHEKAAKAEDEEFTDDAEIWGRFCGQVAAIPGEAQNKKITFPEDLN